MQTVSDGEGGGIANGITGRREGIANLKIGGKGIVSDTKYRVLTGLFHLCIRIFSGTQNDTPSMHTN